MAHNDNSLYEEFALILQGADFAACLRDETTIALACSGGTDSLALALLLRRWCDSEGKHLKALVVNHALRCRAAAEAQEACRQLQNINVEAEILSPPHNKTPPRKSQAEARRIRYDLLTEYCARHAMRALFIAHHEQDQAETFWLRLRRGSHIKGLGGMDFITKRQTPCGKILYLLRPLLQINRQRLRHAVTKAGLQAIQDPSNENRQFDRIRIRQCLPELEKIGLTTEKIAQTTAHMRIAHDFIATQAEPYIRQLQCHPTGYISAERNLWREAHPLLHYVLLAHIWQRFGHKTYPPRAAALARIADSITAKTPIKPQALAGVLSFAQKDKVLFCREYAAMDRRSYVLPELADGFVWDNRFQITFNGTKPYRLAPLSPKTPNLSQLFGDHKNKIHCLPYAVRRALPAIYDDNGLCAYPLLNLYRTDTNELRNQWHCRTIL